MEKITAKNILADWENPPVSVSLRADEVHIWKCMFASERDELKRFNGLLSSDELIKAKRFVRIQDRERYTYFHGVLRNILGIYTSIPAQLITFKKNQYGKPEVLSEKRQSLVRFNLSHSQDLALIGITLDREIGVDVEYCRPIPEAKSIAQNYFADEEKLFLFSLYDNEFIELFFVYWTLKEAYLKAIGKGLYIPHDQFTMRINHERKYGKEDIHIEAICNHQNFQSISLMPQKGYVGAMVTGPFLKLRFFKLS